MKETLENLVVVRAYGGVFELGQPDDGGSCGVREKSVGEIGRGTGK